MYNILLVSRGGGRYHQGLAAASIYCVRVRDVSHEALHTPCMRALGEKSTCAGERRGSPPVSAER